MSEGIFTIELGEYGFMLDTAWCYVAISWELLALSVVGVTLYKVIKRKKNNSVKSYNPPLVNNNNDWN